MILHPSTTRSPFDEIAGSYDTAFEDNPVTRAIRPIIQESLLKYFRKGDHILELNCGTGTDALFLSHHGIRVTATDQSPAMIECAIGKSRGDTGMGPINFAVMEFDDVHRLAPMKFDGGFSNFGGLNCATDIRRLSEAIALALKHGSPFLACILNRYCIWEIMSFTVRGRLREAFRRLRGGPTFVPLGSGSAAISYYSPRSFAGFLQQSFEAVEWYGVNILSPGPNSSSFIRRFPRLTSMLLRIDAAVRRIPPFTLLGDHFVMVARRKQT